MISVTAAKGQRFQWVPFMGPFALFLLLLLVIPLLNLIAFSFFTYSSTGIASTSTLQRISTTLWDSYFIALIGRTMRLGLFTTLLCLRSGISRPLISWLVPTARCGGGIVSAGNAAHG